MFGAFYWPRSTKTEALSGLFAGSIVTILFTFIVPSPLDLHAEFWGLIATTVVFVAVSLVTEVEDKEFAQDIIRESRPTPSTAQTSSESSSVTATDGGTRSDEAE